MGQTKEYNAKLYFPTKDLKKALELLDEVSIENRKLIENGNIKIYNNVNSVLNKLSQKMNLYIVSNSASNDYIKAFTKHVTCTFKDTLASGSIGLTKSNGIKYIIKKNEIQNVIYVGDTELDRQSANEVNIPFVYAEYGFGDIENYEYTIKNIDELENEILRVRQV